MDAPNPATNPACQGPVTDIPSALGLLQAFNHTWLILDPVILLVQLVLLRIICYYVRHPLFCLFRQDGYRAEGRA